MLRVIQPPKSPRSWSRAVTATELLAAAAAIFILLGPFVLLVTLSDSKAVRFLFGGYRLLAYYVVAFLVMYFVGGLSRQKPGK